MLMLMKRSKTGRADFQSSAVCALALWLFSLQSHAGVTFESYSDFEITGHVDDVLSLDSDDFYHYSDHPAIPAFGVNSDNVELGLVSSPDARAEASASLELSAVSTVADTTTLSGSAAVSANSFSIDVRSKHANADASVIIDIDFSVDALYSFIFDSVLIAAGDQAEVYYSMFDYAAGTDIFDGILNNDDDNPIYYGDLMAGDYNLYIEAIIITDAAASGEEFGQASADFSLALTREPVIPGVPVPAAVWLFVSGLSGIFLVSRRHSVSC